jgi:hypothetical protein
MSNHLVPLYKVPVGSPFRVEFSEGLIMDFKFLGIDGFYGKCLDEMGVTHYLTAMTPVEILEPVTIPDVSHPHE